MHSIFSFIRPYFRGQFCNFSRRFCTEETLPKNVHNSPASASNSRDTNIEEQRLLDMAEYYTQYIKEYEQDGQEDEETAEWKRQVKKMVIARGRGETGVFDVHEMVEFLRAEKVQDMCVLKMPKSFAYPPHMIVGTAMSVRHMKAVTEKIRVTFKKKRAMYDPPTLNLDHAGNKEWRAYDLGNIAVHILMENTRKRYDIEMLWAVGPENDELTNVNESDQLDEYGQRLKKLQEDIEWLRNVEVEGEDDGKENKEKGKMN